MASLRRNIYLNCTTNPAVSALIGDRIYFGRLPEGVVLPAVSFSQVTDTDAAYRAHGEAAERAVGQISFNCWAETADGAADLADALVAAWSGYKSPPDIGWAQIMVRIDNFESGLDRFRTIVDVQIDYLRTYM